MPCRILLVIALVGTVAGCQSPGLFSRNTTIGSLKAGVSQLEFQNEQLQKQVADLKSENRRYEDRLVQEEAENGYLATKVDDLSNQLGLRGSDSRTTRTKNNDVDDLPPPTKARRTTRKPPAASIPGRIEPTDESPGDDLRSDRSSRYPSDRGRTVSRTVRDDRWLPVDQGLGVRR